jgi:hypothetical protein
MDQNTSLQPVIDVVEKAKRTFREMLVSVSTGNGLTQRQYGRYMSMQYHLTKDVQRHFFAIAGNPCLARRKPLRDFLFRFAMEEEPHYLVAKDDLDNLGAELLPRPFDVALWQRFFLKQARERPFIRLGATCVLENLGSGAGVVGHELLAKTPFLNKKNTRFIEIHFHEALPHGDQIYDALKSVPLSAEEVEDARCGACYGAIFYLRFAAWVFERDPIVCAFDPGVEAPL